MAKGIVAKIWNISVGSGSRTAAAQISSSIEYIENPEKVGVVLDIDNANLLTNQLTYVTNDVKTMDGLYVGGRHIVDFDNATNEMIKKDNDVQTFKEIVAFYEGKRLDDIHKQREIGKRPYQKILLVIGSAVLTLVICVLIDFLMHIFLNE